MEYKSAKRMKKRRELDALVGNGKVRRKSRSGHELLRSNDSESSDADEFSLTSTKSYVKHGSGSLCSTCASVGAFLLLAVCLLLCGGLTWMHLEMKDELESLRQSLKTAQSRADGSSGDISRLSGQLQDVNKTLQSFRTGNRGLESAFKNISDISEKVSQVNSALEKLQEGLKAAPELKTLPDKLQAVSSSVAGLGSTVNTMTDEIKSFGEFQKKVQTDMASFTDQMTSLQERVAGVESSGSREGGGSGLELQTLQSQITSANASLWNQIQTVQSGLQDQQTHFTLLDNITTQLQKNVSLLLASVAIRGPGIALGPTTDVASEEFRSQVEDIVREVLQSSGGSAPGTNDSESSDVRISQPQMDELLAQLQNMTAIITSLQERAHSVEILNTTVVQIKSDIDHLSKMVTDDSSQLHALRAELDGLKGYMALLEQRISAPENGITGSLPSGGNPDQEPTESASPSSNNEGPTPPANSTATSAPTEDSGTGTDHLSIPGIETAEDLKLNFHRWDRTGEGEVLYNVLSGFIGDSHTPAEEELRKYDKNGDNMYSLEEFAAALGIDLETESSSTATPPRS